MDYQTYIRKEMNCSLLLILLSIGSTGTVSQSISTHQQDNEYCAKSIRLSYMHPKDSTRHQVVLDSVNRLLVGRWKLIDIGTQTYTVMPMPGDSIEMSVDGKGNAIVYARGKQLVDFHLAAGINYGNLRCVISEAGRAYFRFGTSLVSDGQGGMSKGQAIYRNGLRVCEEYLELYRFTSSGPSYIFNRLTPVQVAIKKRN